MDALAEEIQKSLDNDKGDYYTVFIIPKNEEVATLMVVRIPNNFKEKFYKIEKDFEVETKTTTDLILLARMCAYMIESRVLSENA